MTPFSLTRPVRAQAADLNLLFRDVGDALARLTKAGAAVKTHALSGELYASPSGWILLRVPNALVRGAFDALDENGAQLPLYKDKLNAHISVMRPEELARIGGVDKVTERGHHFHYTLGPIKEVEPAGWAEMSKVWFIEVESPELKELRKSYGMSPLPDDGKKPFHITLAVRKKNVLKPTDDVVKHAADKLASLLYRDLAEPEDVRLRTGLVGDEARPWLGLQRHAKPRALTGLFVDDLEGQLRSVVPQMAEYDLSRLSPGPLSRADDETLLLMHLLAKNYPREYRVNSDRVGPADDPAVKLAALISLDEVREAGRARRAEKRGPAAEYCPHCDARLERDPYSGTCNSCGEDWPQEKAAAFGGREKDPRWGCECPMCGGTNTIGARARQRYPDGTSGPANAVCHDCDDGFSFNYDTMRPEKRSTAGPVKAAAFVPVGGTVSYDYHCAPCAHSFDEDSGPGGACPICGGDRSATTTNPKRMKAAGVLGGNQPPKKKPAKKPLVDPEGLDEAVSGLLTAVGLGEAE